MKQAIYVLIGCLGLAGCTSLEEDFRKATLISEVELGSPKSYTRTLRAPTGSARLIIAIPNHRCAPVQDAPISLAVRSDRAILFTERVRLSQLTWSYGRDSCDAYGYLYSSSTGGSSPRYGEMRIDVKDDQGPLIFEIDVSQVASSPTRRASIWLIYGDRVPGAKIFGEKT